MPRLDTGIPPYPVWQEEPVKPLASLYTADRRVRSVSNITIYAAISEFDSTSSSSGQTEAMRWVDWDKFFGMPGAVEAYTTFGTNNKLQALPPAPLTEHSIRSSSPTVVAISEILVEALVSNGKFQPSSSWTEYRLHQERLTWENFYILPGAEAELVKMFTRMGV
ncbi:hypothetical protein GQ43DRAFT_100949 [Delitschia confertaspora ATCC 74209]|uniref:Uncharacterized protein n=1 Tax=Delitschia confertaspora ATCC 74209 TaxID=1513339 RepID=A0A9P4MRD6_9PLEO|nr:hypothetical protein GQ43DRAFT_100949 [Delitschia confertaspora ATCC 74209]